MRKKLRHISNLVLAATLLFLVSAILAGTISLTWEQPDGLPVGTIVEVWSSTNPATITNEAERIGTNLWTLRTNAASNAATLPKGERAEWFKVRNRAPDGQLSEWSQKPTL